MALIEEYYELNEAEEVSAIWKTLQIGFYACAACLGLWCGYTLAILRLRFDDRCYLFTEVKASNLKDGKLDQSSIDWESDSWCDYYQFSMVSSFIVAIIWATFFLMCGKGGKSLTGLPQPWRIVWTSLIFNFIYFVIVLSTAISIQQGTDCFCARHDFDQKLQTKALEDNCAPLKFLLEKDLYITSIQLEIVVKTSWGCAVSWILLFLLSFFRIVFVVDFYIYKICVFRIDDTVQNKKEEVLRITNYEEPRQLQFGKNDQKRAYYSISVETFDDLEAGEVGHRKKTKVDKKSMRQYFNAASRTSPQANAAFYVTADLRLLSREKKKKKPTKVLDEAFLKDEVRLGPELRKAIRIASDSNLSDGSNIPKYLYKYSPEFLGQDDDDQNDEIRPSCTFQRRQSKEDWDDPSDSESEIFVGNFNPTASLRFKKRI